jgi:hypothetical protein
MKIDHYAFGKIIVDGKSYSSDIIIFPDHVQSSWWRLEGHLLQTEDLEGVVAAKVPELIIGTGYYGAMNVPEETLRYLKGKKIQAYIERSGKAVELYNRMSSEKPVIAALHLTC